MEISIKGYRHHDIIFGINSLVNFWKPYACGRFPLFAIQFPTVVAAYASNFPLTFSGFFQYNEA